MVFRIITKLCSVLLLLSVILHADDGYRLWLKYDLVSSPQLLENYRASINSVVIKGQSETIEAAEQELNNGLSGLLGSEVPRAEQVRDGAILVARFNELSGPAKAPVAGHIERTGSEGFIIMSAEWQSKKVVIITANRDTGLLYGVFHFLRLLQTGKPIDNLKIVSVPRIQLRVLNHWDNLDRTVERGYAGFSLWDWQKLPDYHRPYYRDYARANASIGINGTVLNNVNANPRILTPLYLKKVAALANIFRPYGLKVYLSIKFSAPMLSGGMETADPLDEAVQAWWQAKVREIYQYIPDFGGFLVKANSEGQPGPQDFGRSHADGANMLADALQPYGGIVMWRAFVYKSTDKEDRAKQAYNEFKPLDGVFRDNVLIQAKNGPIDFQPREPFHPLFGGLSRTPS